MRDTDYYRQARLVMTILPWLQAETDVCLKGGTAINFFHRNLPRLSVDIDMTYLPIRNRAASLAGITGVLERVARRIEALPGMTIIPKIMQDGTVATLFVRNQSVQIKIEVNTVLRGTVFPGSTMTLCPAGEELFNATTEAQVVSIPDLYGGKICAALDRQHPRDLFDVMLLLEDDGITREIRQAFIVYLVSHSRPMAELLQPHELDIETLFGNEFQGMTSRPVQLEELTAVRKELIREIRTGLTSDEREFILSVKQGQPSWQKLNLPGIEHLPGIQWKLMNLERMDSRKHSIAVEKLRSCLGI